MPRSVYVEWEDAVHRYGWQDGLVPAQGLSPVQSLGWLLAESDECIILAQSVAADSHAQTVQIPRGMIRDLRDVELPT